MTILAFVEMGKVNEQVNHIAKSNLPKLTSTFAVQNAIQNVTRSAILIVSVEDPVFRAKTQETIAKDRATYNVTLKKIEALENSEEGKALIGKAKQAIKTLADANYTAIDYAMAGKQADADKALKGAMAPLANVTKIFNEMTEYQNGRADKRRTDAEMTYTLAVSSLTTICIIAILIAIAGAVLITRSITIPLGRMRSMIEDIAQGEGDLTKRLDASSRDELGETSRWFNVFVGKLQGIIGQLAQSTSEVASASNQLQATAEQMATGAEEVAAQAGTVATAGEEMAATSGDIAQNCQFAAEGSKKASAAAISGAKVVDETINVMNSIADRVSHSAKAVERLCASSDKIG